MSRINVSEGMYCCWLCLLFSIVVGVSVVDAAAVLVSLMLLVLQTRFVDNAGCCGVVVVVSAAVVAVLLLLLLCCCRCW